MSDSVTDRLEAVKTAIDAVIAAMGKGQYMLSYQVGDRTYTGESSASLLKTLRAEEARLEAKLAAETRTGGSVGFTRILRPQ